MGASSAKIILALSYLNGRKNLTDPLGYNALARASKVGRNHLSRELLNLRDIITKVGRGYKIEMNRHSVAVIHNIMVSTDDRFLARFLSSDLHVSWLRNPSYINLLVSTAFARLICGAEEWNVEAFDDLLPELPLPIRQSVEAKDVRKTAMQLWFQTGGRRPLIASYVPAKEGSQLWQAAFLSPCFFRFAWNTQPWPGKVVKRDDGFFRLWIFRRQNPEKEDQMMSAKTIAHLLVALASMWMQEDTARFPEAMQALDRLYQQPVQLKVGITSEMFEAQFIVGEGMTLKSKNENLSKETESTE